MQQRPVQRDLKLPSCLSLAGRNIHALDPYRMPGASALERGSRAAASILDSHCQANAGALPETVAINLWGLDAIKTKGESVAMVLHMVRP